MGRIDNGKKAFDILSVRVLLVDGDEKYQLELKRNLDECGYDVRICNSGEKALAQLRKDRNGFDIMMTERKLPDMDGFTLLQQVVKEMHLPVIVISSDNESTTKEKILNNGAYYYLVKPISMDVLDMVVQNLYREKISKAAELQQPTKAKKKRVYWTKELHKIFIESVDQVKTVDFQKPTPKMILNRMEMRGVKGLTVENVKSHKQKWEKRPQDKQRYNGPSPGHVESMNLATQLRPASAAMNINSHHIGAPPDCPSLQFPFVASSGAIEDASRYQSNNVMSQTLSGGKICNELSGGPVFDNGTSNTAYTNLVAKIPPNQDLDESHFPSDNVAIYRTSEHLNKFDSDSWVWSNSGYNDFKTSNNTFLPSSSGNFGNSFEIPNNTFFPSVSGYITNSVEIPSTSPIDKDTLVGTSLEGTCGYQSDNVMTQIMTQIPSSGQICNELPGGQAFDYNMSIDAPTSLLANNPQNQAFQLENDPANCLPDWSNFNGDHNLTMISGDCDLIDFDNLCFGSIVSENVACDDNLWECDLFS